MAGYYELKNAKDGKIYWHLKAGNHETILSSEMYRCKNSALNAINSIQSNAENEKQYKKRQQTNGRLYFVLKARNGQVIGMSDAYSSNQSLNKGIQSVMKNGSTTEIKDMTE